MRSNTLQTHSQKVHLLGMKGTIKKHTSKGTKNTFGTHQKENIPFEVYLL